MVLDERYRVENLGLSPAGLSSSASDLLSLARTQLFGTRFPAL